MTEVSESILRDLERIGDIPISNQMRLVISILIEVIAKLVGSDEAIIETLIALECDVKGLKQFRKFKLDQ
jgi:hypothetical protein